MINFDYIRASSAASAIAAINQDTKAQFIAGGTNLVDLMKRGVTAPEKLIDITRVPLKEITSSDKVTSVGALVLNSALADDAMILKKHPLLSQALRAGASAQIRNMATVGGNMLQRTRCPYFYDTALPCNKREEGSGCSALEGYSRMHAIFGTSASCIAVHPSDMCVALAALNATVLVEGKAGPRKIPFTEFHRLPGNTPSKDNNLQPGELITGIEIPEHEGLGKHTAYVKVRDRSSYAFALVSVAAALHLDGKKIKEARIAMGGVAHKPWRLTEAEKFLEGKTASLSNFQQAAGVAMKDAKAYKGNLFKLKLAPKTLAHALQKAAGLI